MSCSRFCIQMMVTLFFGLLPFLTATAQPVVVYTTELPGLHQHDGQGRYDRLLEQAGRASNLEVRAVFLPANRAITAYQTCDNCCISPCVKTDGMTYCRAGHQSQPLGHATLHAFTKAGSSPVDHLDQLIGKTIGAERGKPLGHDIDRLTLDIMMVEDPAQAAAMLDLNRLDVFLAWSPETPTFLTTHGLPHLSYDPKAAFLSVSDSLGCKGPGGTKLIKALNQLLKRS